MFTLHLGQLSVAIYLRGGLDTSGKTELFAYHHGFLHGPLPGVAQQSPAPRVEDLDVPGIRGKAFSQSQTGLIAQCWDDHVEVIAPHVAATWLRQAVMRVAAGLVRVVALAKTRVKVCPRSTVLNKRSALMTVDELAAVGGVRPDAAEAARTRR